jgi:hypothetical protein
VAEAGQAAAEQQWEHGEPVEKVEAEARGAEAEEESLIAAVVAPAIVADVAAATVGVVSVAAVEVVAEVKPTRCCRVRTSMRLTRTHLQSEKEKQRIRRRMKRKRSS